MTIKTLQCWPQPLPAHVQSSQLFICLLVCCCYCCCCSLFMLSFSTNKVEYNIKGHRRSIIPILKIIISLTSLYIGLLPISDLYNEFYPSNDSEISAISCKIVAILSLPSDVALRNFLVTFGVKIHESGRRNETERSRE